MMTKNADKKRGQVLMFCMDDMVPQNHMLRLIDKAIDWNFIYELVEEKYCPDNGRPSMDPVMLIKIPFIQYLYGIKSMRQTIREIEVDVAYRWFLGLDMLDPAPHFSTFGKNYTRRFKDTDLFEQIFSKILEGCMKYKLVDTEQIFMDSTHVKACANEPYIQGSIHAYHTRFLLHKQKRVYALLSETIRFLGRWCCIFVFLHLPVFLFPNLPGCFHLLRPPAVDGHFYLSMAFCHAVPGLLRLPMVPWTGYAGPSPSFFNFW